MGVYSKQPWRNKDATTPASAARMEHIEDGILEASQAAELARGAVEGRLSEANLSTTIGGLTAPAVAQAQAAATAAQEAIDSLPEHLDTEDGAIAGLASSSTSETRQALNAGIVAIALTKLNAPVNARDEGAKGDSTNEGDALRDASLTAIEQGRALFVPRGEYRTPVTVPWSGRFFGEGQDMATIYGTDPTKPVIASKSWLTEFGGSPTSGDVLENIRVRFGHHGVVLKSWRSRIENVFVDYSAGNGIHGTAFNEAGASPDASLVGNMFKNVRVGYAAGIPLQCGELDNGKMTDGEVTKAVLIHTATSPYALLCGVSAGWQFDLLHTYGDAAGLTAAVRLQRAGNTQMGRVLIERYKGYALWAQLALTLSVDALNVYTTQEGGSLVRLERSSTYPTSAAHFGSISARSDAAFTSVIHNVSSASEVKVNALDIQGEFRAPLASGTGAKHVRMAALTPLASDPGGTIWGYSAAGAADGPLAFRASTSGDQRDVYWSTTSTVVVASGAISFPATTGAFVEATMDSGLTSGDVSATYAGGEAGMAVVAAYVSDANCVYASLSAAGTVTLAKRVGSSSGTTVASVSHTRAPGDVVTVRRNGTQYSVLVNGTEVIAPQAITEHAAATKHGVAATGSTGQSLTVSGVEFKALP